MSRLDLQRIAMRKAREFAVKARAALPKPKAFMVKDEGDSATLYFYGQIGVDWWSGEGITAKATVQALDELKAAGCKNIAVRIVSEGGDVFEGKAIYEALKRCGIEVATYNDSLAASAASFIAMAGKTVYSAPTATWMIHRAWALAAADCEGFRAMADILEMEDTTIAGIYAKKTGKSIEECITLMSAETWMNAEKAKELGFADIADDDEGTGDDAGAGSDEGASDSVIFRIAAKTQQRIDAHNRERLAALTAKTSQIPPGQPGKRAGQPAK